MNTWNGLPSRYWEKVLGNVRAKLNAQIRNTGVNSAPCDPIDTRGISYNRAAMEALLGEPEVEQPNFMRVEIPEASSVYFEAEGGVGLENMGEENEPGPPVPVDIGEVEEEVEGEDGDSDGEEEGDRDEDGDGDRDGDGDGATEAEDEDVDQDEDDEDEEDEEDEEEEEDEQDEMAG